MGLFRRLSAAAAAASLFVVAPALPAAASSPTATSAAVSGHDLVVDRVSGADRMATAVEISKTYFPDGADVVYLATSKEFADALVAGPAAAVQGGPVLLTPAGELDARVADEITRLDPAKVVLVGGEGALSKTVEQQVGAAATGKVERIGGANRYETARQLVLSVFGEAPVAFVATGRNFPDALSAAGAAGYEGAPVVLVPGDKKAPDSRTRALLEQLGTEETVVVGGPAAVSDDFVYGLLDDGYDVWQYEGGNRYETNEFVTYEIALEAETAFIATGLDFPDALAGAAVAAAQGAPVFLSKPTCIPRGIAENIDEAEYLERITLLGGPTVLGPGVESLTTC